jgi:branched-chain amino acid transport system permease protein
VFYREAGQFKTSYAADQSVFPINFDRWFIAAALVVAFVVIPLTASEYWLQAVLIPILVFTMAALGLNLLVGYTGQLSLGTGGFMAVGAFMTYKITTAFPELNIILVFFASGLCAGGVGLIFGIPSLRIKGFYLAVSTLAAQFFLVWIFNKIEWFYNYNPSGSISAPPREMFGVMITGPTAVAEARYIVALVLVLVFAIVAKNLVRGSIGRSWMAVRDMDIAAEIIGIQPFKAKLVAFAVSSFYCGMAGAMMVFLWLGSAETEAFSITESFNVLFMIIIGGLGSIMGSFFGAAFIVGLPILLSNVPQSLGLAMAIDTQKHIEVMVFGSLIIFFLIVEPHGLARLWQITKEKLRLWPFPY